MIWIMQLSETHNGSCHVVLILTTVNQTGRHCEIIMNDAYALLCHLNFRLVNLVSETVCIWTTKAGCCEINQFEKKTFPNVTVEFASKSVLVTYFCIASSYLLLSLWSWQSGAEGTSEAENELGVGAVVLFCCYGQNCITHSAFLLPARDIYWEWLIENEQVEWTIVIEKV